jgi:hypothetical protein
MRYTLNDVVDYLISKAVLSALIAVYPHYRPNANIPEREKPGWVIKHLPKEIRERVKELKAKHFYHPRMVGEK